MGAADKAEGAVKDAAGSATSDTKTQIGAKADKAEGSAESAAGGAKDAVRDAADKIKT